MIFLTSANESAIISANAQISLNCGLPNDQGTRTWSVVRKVEGQDVWFIDCPPVDGWGNPGHHFSKLEMMNGVDLSNINESSLVDADLYKGSNDFN